MQKKWAIVSVLIIQGQRRFNISLKLCLNLCSRRRLKPIGNLVNSSIFTESLLLKVFLWADVIIFNNVSWNKLYGVNLWILRFNLFCALTKLGINEFFRYSDLQAIVLNELTLTSWKVFLGLATNQK